MESNGVLAPFWSWLQYAVYEGERTIHERPVDLWGASVSVACAVIAYLWCSRFVVVVHTCVTIKYDHVHL